MKIIKLGKTKEELKKESDIRSKEYKAEFIKRIEKEFMCNKCGSILLVTPEDVIDGCYIICPNCDNKIHYFDIIMTEW